MNLIKKFYLLFFSMCLCSQSAWADSYEITIKNLSQNAETRVISCAEKKQCLLDFPFHSGEIHVAIKPAFESIYFQFMNEQQYLASTSTGKRTYEISLKEISKIHTVDLYVPNPAAESDQQDSLRSSPVLRVSNSVLVTLNISVKREH